jgi:hypothetical protein
MCTVRAPRQNQYFGQALSLPQLLTSRAPAQFAGNHHDERIGASGRVRSSGIQHQRNRYTNRSPHGYGTDTDVVNEDQSDQAGQQMAEHHVSGLCKRDIGRSEKQKARRTKRSHQNRYVIRLRDSSDDAYSQRTANQTTGELPPRGGRGARAAAPDLANDRRHRVSR